MKKNYLLLICMMVLLLPNLLAQQQDFWESPYEWDVPYVPTPYEVVHKMLEMAKIGPSDILYDLGCGDGRIVVMAASQFGVKGVGIDIDPERIKECYVNAANAKVEEKVMFLNQDLFETDIREASVVTLYLLSTVNIKLRPKLLNDLKPGTRVLSHDFSMGEWNHDQRQNIHVDDRTHVIYYWIIPANASGKWMFVKLPDILDSPNSLYLVQNFQKIQGIVNSGAATIPIQNAELKGNSIKFSIELKHEQKTVKWSFEGQLQEHTIKGTLHNLSEEGKRIYNWQAEREPQTKIPLDSGNSKEIKHSD